MTVYVVMWESDEGFSNIEAIYSDWLCADMVCQALNESPHDPETGYAVYEYHVS